MIDYVLLNIILEMEKTGVEYGQYIMAGMFGFVIAIFLLGGLIPCKHQFCSTGSKAEALDACWIEFC